MKIRTGYRCRGCGSQAVMVLDVHPQSPQATAETMHEARREMMRELEERHPADCEEAARLNACRAVHDS